MGRAWAGWCSGSLWVGGAADKITQSVYEAKSYNKRNHFERAEMLVEILKFLAKISNVLEKI